MDRQDRQFVPGAAPVTPPAAPQPVPASPIGTSPSPTKPDIASVNASHYSIDSFGRIIFFVVLAQIVIIIGLNLYQNSRIGSLQKSLDAKKAQLETANYKTLNDQVNQVLSGNTQLTAALAGKVQWSKFYNQLNAITPKDVQLTTFSIAENGTFKADGRTANLDSLAKAMTTWQKGVDGKTTPFATIILTSNNFAIGTNGTRVVTFSVSGQVNKGAIK